jgi:putative lipoic acid-binding regulatory protein
MEEEQKPPQIEFPCPYPIKIMGLDENDFAASVIAIVRRHDPGVRDEDISFRPSRNGKYLSVNVMITAQGPAHIQTLFEDLKASGRVAMVL